MKHQKPYLRDCTLFYLRIWERRKQELNIHTEDGAVLRCGRSSWHIDWDRLIDSVQHLLTSNLFQIAKLRTFLYGDIIKGSKWLRQQTSPT